MHHCISAGLPSEEGLEPCRAGTDRKMCSKNSAAVQFRVGEQSRSAVCVRGICQLLAEWVQQSHPAALLGSWLVLQPWRLGGTRPHKESAENHLCFLCGVTFQNSISFKRVWLRDLVFLSPSLVEVYGTGVGQGITEGLQVRE